MEFNIQKVETFTGHRDSVFTLSSIATGDRFYSSGADGLVVCWNIFSPELGIPLAQMTNSVYTLSHFDDKNEVWIANNNDGIHVINTIENKKTGFIKLNNTSYFGIERHENHVFIGDKSGTLYKIDMELYAIKNIAEYSEKSVRCIAINPCGQELAVGYSDWKIRIFDLETLKLKHELEGHKNSVFTLKYNGENMLVSGSRDAHLMAWSVQNQYELSENVPAHNFSINDIVFVEKYQWLISCSMDKNIKIWDAKNLKLLKVIDKARHAGHGTSINKLIWLEKSEYLVSASDDRTISLWKLF